MMIYIACDAVMVTFSEPEKVKGLVFKSYFQIHSDLLEPNFGLGNSSCFLIPFQRELYFNFHSFK